MLFRRLSFTVDKGVDFGALAADEAFANTKCHGKDQSGDRT